MSKPKAVHVKNMKLYFVYESENDAEQNLNSVKGLLDPSAIICCWNGYMNAVEINIILLDSLE